MIMPHEDESVVAEGADGTNIFRSVSESTTIASELLTSTGATGASSSSGNETAPRDIPTSKSPEVVADDTPSTSPMSFEDLNLSPELLQGLHSEMKFEKPNEIQARMLPRIVSPAYQNLIAQAHSGSGKTTCCVLGMLNRVDPQLKAPQAVYVCSTPEQVIQTGKVVNRMGKNMGITTACTATAETRWHLFLRRPEKVVDQIVIGTSVDLLSCRTWGDAFDTRDVKILVFDEADKLLDPDGHDTWSSLSLWSDIDERGEKCQILLFCATNSEKVKAFVKTIPGANIDFVEKEQLSSSSIGKDADPGDADPLVTTESFSRDRIQGDSFLFIDWLLSICFRNWLRFNLEWDHLEERHAAEAKEAKMATEAKEAKMAAEAKEAKKREKQVSKELRKNGVPRRKRRAALGELKAIALSEGIEKMVFKPEDVGKLDV